MSWLRDHGVSGRKLLLASALPALLLVAEWQFSMATRAPLLAGLAADVVLLVIVTFVVDAVIKTRERRRKQAAEAERQAAEAEHLDLVGRIMHRALAQMAFDGQRRIDAHFSGFDLDAIGMAGWPTSTRALVAASLESVGLDTVLAPRLDPEERRKRLALLSRRPAWLQSLYREVASYKRGSHRLIGQWAPLLMAVPGREDNFAVVQTFADALDHVQRVLYDSAVTLVPTTRWRRPVGLLDELHDAIEAFIQSAEVTRSHFHLLSKEVRGDRATDLEPSVALTAQPPKHLAAVLGHAEHTEGQGDRPVT